MLQALVDADILVYRVGYTTNDTDAVYARARLDEAIEKILMGLESHVEKEVQPLFYLTSTDKSNYRFALAHPDRPYKGNRVQPKPDHYETLRSHLEKEYCATVVYGQEADDALGIEAVKNESVIVTIDKDLDMIPGLHYNFVKDYLYHVSDEAAEWHFWYQVLVGDVTDNVPGCPKIGDAKALKLLSEAKENYYQLCLDAYLKYYKDLELAKTELCRNAKLLWIRRHENEEWDENIFSKGKGEKSPEVGKGQDSGEVPGTGEG
jgi:DNA polymerase-1